ncbi:phage/plasmid primase, P4 family [Priestia megaterium]|uniref:phage/plasmid primase, P4 family n=1 Tax=Priestia megaterium TaxID=1404 RepID=UPI002E23C5D2|nr:phage/plasmid primase, P4 family [Priestia megaterium]MED4061688.1 phage/plasmid primase, P4 family [Priestia megaterium]
MTDLFKGYVLTKDKKCIEKFKNRSDFKTYDQVKSLPEFAGILNDGIILIDIDDFEQSEILMNIVDDLQLRCRVYKTSRGKHFLFKNTEVETCKTHTKLAVGLTSDIKLGSRNSYSILKYDNKERPILYDKLDDEDYEELPKWLLPIKTNQEFLEMSAGDGRNQSLFNYILTLQSNGYSPEEVKECIRLINKYVLSDCLSDNELEVILREESFQKPVFFNGRTFLFDKFANFLISNLHIIKINGQLHMYKDGVYMDGLSAIESQMIKHIPNLNRTKRAEVMAYIDIAVTDNTVVSPANFIPFKDGIYDIENDTFTCFDSSIVVTNKINFRYNPNAYSEVVDKTLDKLACNDDNVRDLLEEVIGYCFYRRNELRKSFILIGDKANGKSTFLDMIKTLLGDDNTAALDLKELGDRFKTAELFGKLANIGDDIGDEFIPNPAVFKKLVSGDRLNAERKGRDPFDFNNYSKLLFSANNIPRIKDKSGSVIDRLIIVPFDARFSPNDPDFDPYIKYKLRTDEAMEYLIQLGLDGLKRVLKNRKFTTSDKVVKEIAEYEENNNPILLFFKELEETDFTVENESTKDVYKRYSEFCIINNFTPMSNIEFSKQVKKHYDFSIITKSISGKKYRVFVKN